MDIQPINNRQKLLLAFSTAGMASIFLPWIKLSGGGTGKTITGLHGYGILVFVIFLAVAVLTIFEDFLIVYNKKLSRIINTAGALALLFIIIEEVTFSQISITQLSHVRITYEPGACAAATMCVAIVISSIVCKTKKRSAQTEAKNLKKNILIPATSRPAKNIHSKSGESKMIDLRKLIRLKENGCITEEEFQQLKSKMIISNLSFGFLDPN